jgi:hypothetical protein
MEHRQLGSGYPQPCTGRNKPLVSTQKPKNTCAPGESDDLEEFVVFVCLIPLDIFNKTNYLAYLVVEFGHSDL